jgi:predicted transcriptional regulator of viral defense system
MYLARNRTEGYVSCVRAAGSPDWDALYEVASAQAGHFTTQQAARAGYSTQLLLKHIKAGRVIRIRHGVYRLVHFPAGEHEDLMVLWLWSAQAGVFSHQTALSLHGLSDALPAQIHITLPVNWRSRRLRVPTGVVLHHAVVTQSERTWFGAVPVTAARRTLKDCARAAIAPDLLRQAARQALGRGLVKRADLRDVERALAPFGGFAA